MMCMWFVMCDCRMVYSSLRKLRHDNGSHCCLLYSETEFEDDHKQGPIVNFNLLKPDGQALGYGQVEKLACVFDIHLRTGCFCNTGACMRFLGLKSETLKYHLEVSLPYVNFLSTTFSCC